MATSLRGGGARERSHKGVMSPSHSLAKKSPKPSLSVSTSSTSPITSAKTSSHIDKKQTSTYVRPTKSLKEPKTLDSLTKSNIDPTVLKQPTAARRRSLDQHALASYTQKSIQGGRDARHVRSSSFSNRSTSSSTRAAPDRPSSNLVKRDVRKVDSKTSTFASASSTASKSRNPSKGTTLPSKAILSKATPPTNKSLALESSNDCRDNSTSIEHFVSDEEIAYTQYDIPSLPEISEMPDSNEDLKDPTNYELNTKHSFKEYKNEGIEKEQEKTIEIEKQEEEDEAIAKQIVEEVRKIEEHNDEAAREENVEETPSREKEEEEVPAKEEEKIEVEDKKEVAISFSRSSSPRSSPPRVQQVVEKRESQAYNDVIEQTASKLRGRKNKVLALAGAFETVISLQN